MLKKNSWVQKILSYGFVGVIGTIVHFLTLIILVEVFKVGPILSSVIGFILTVILSFFLNSTYTFKGENRKRKYVFVKYVIVSLVGLSVNSLIMFFTITFLSLHYSIGQCIVIISIPVLNFLLNNFWTFSDKTSKGNIL
jgi:putative flippase GtrA